MERPFPPPSAGPASTIEVGLARRAYRALSRHDLDGLLVLLDPSVELDPLTPDAPYRGHEGAREWWSDLFSAIPDFAAEVRSIGEFHGMLLANLCLHGHGARSQAPFEQTVWELSEWNNEKVVRWHTYASVLEAHEALAPMAHPSPLKFTVPAGET